MNNKTQVKKRILSTPLYSILSPIKMLSIHIRVPPCWRLAKTNIHVKCSVIGSPAGRAYLSKVGCLITPTPSRECHASVQLFTTSALYKHENIYQVFLRNLHFMFVYIDCKSFDADWLCLFCHRTVLELIGHRSKKMSLLFIFLWSHQSLYVVYLRTLPWETIVVGKEYSRAVSESNIRLNWSHLADRRREKKTTNTTAQWSIIRVQRSRFIEKSLEGRTGVNSILVHAIGWTYILPW